MRQTYESEEEDEGEGITRPRARGRGSVTLRVVATVTNGDGTVSTHYRLVWAGHEPKTLHLNTDFPKILVTAPFSMVRPVDGDGGVKPITSDLVIPSMLSLAAGSENFFGDFTRDELVSLFMRMLNIRGEPIYVAPSAGGHTRFGWVVDRASRPDDPSYWVSGYIVINNR